MSTRWQRREFLRLALAELGLLPLSSLLGCGGEQAGPPSLMLSERVRDDVVSLERSALIARYFSGADPHDASQLGLYYLSAVAPDANDDALLAALSATIALIESQPDDARALAALLAAARSELQHGDAFDLHGWYLSETELALCGLFWVLASSHALGDAGVDAGASDLNADDARESHQAEPKTGA